MAAVNSEDEPAVPRQDLQQPFAAGRKRHGHRRRRAGAFGKDAHEADNVGSHGLLREMILRHQSDNLAALADHDLGLKRKPAGQFGAELRAGDWPPDHEGTRRADVHGIKVFQLFGERGGSEGSVTAHVNASQKNHECHAFPPAGAARKTDAPGRRRLQVQGYMTGASMGVRGGSAAGPVHGDAFDAAAS